MESFYKKIYSHAWQIVKTNWYVLFFGIFVVALGLTGEFKSLAVLEKEDVLLANLMNWIELLRALLAGGVDLSNFPILSQTIGVLFFFAIILVLGISSQGALINITAQNQKPNGKKTNQGLLAANLNTGVDNFWPLLGLTILNKLVGFVFVAGVIAPLIYAIYLVEIPSLAHFFVALVIFFSFIPLTILISFVTRFGAAYIILKKKTVTQAFFEGWTLFRINWLVSLENAFLVSLLTGLYTVIVISVMALIATPFIIIGLIFLQISSVAFWIVIFAGSLIAVLTFILAASFYGAYYTIVWTEVFLHLVGKTKSISKTERLIKKHVPFLSR